MQTITGTIRRLIQVNPDKGTASALVQYRTPAGLLEGRIHGRLGDLKDGDDFIAEGDWRETVSRGKTEEVFRVLSASLLRPEIVLDQEPEAAAPSGP